MRIGFVGLGKLGLPVALAAESAGHEVVGLEVNQERRRAIANRSVPEVEPELPELLAASTMTLADGASDLHGCDIVFVCVQTPHEPEFEGHVPLTRAPQDFNYRYLGLALGGQYDAKGLVVVVSTCLPGSLARFTHPAHFAYNPLFIAMGSVIPDYRNPEFVLVGGECPDELRDYYATITDAPICTMSIESAELTKVAYNAFIGFKLMLANGIGELCDRTGANADDVMGTLKRADKRLISTAYLTPGMGDGGGCHPRDQIALSWLAGEVGLSSDPFYGVIQAREAHAEWLADIWCDAAGKLPLVMLSEAFKPNSNLTTGSAATLVAHYARARGRRPVIREGVGRHEPSCFFVSCPHRWTFEFIPPSGSVVIDPWGKFPERPNVELIRPGRRDA